jgi:malate dehydrogenase
MHDLAIVGAGELGGLIAHAVARREAAAHIRLIDDSGQVAAGKALDIAEAAPIERFATRLSGSADPSMAAGSTVVVVADRVAGGEWNGEEGLRLLKRLSEIASKSVVLCAGASQRDLIERGVRELHIPRRRLIGSAPEAFAAAARAMVALEADVSPREVALLLAGLPPQHIVLSWEEATIGGCAATRVLSEPSLRRIEGRLPLLWPPGPYALATAAASVIEMIIGRSRRRASCFVAPDDSAGRRARTVALPVRLDRQGLSAVVLPELNARDQVVLDNAMLL